VLWLWWGKTLVSLAFMLSFFFKFSSVIIKSRFSAFITPKVVAFSLSYIIRKTHRTYERMLQIDRDKNLTPRVSGLKLPNQPMFANSGAAEEPEIKKAVSGRQCELRQGQLERQ